MSNDPHSPEVLVQVPTEIEAAAIVTALKARGVKAFTTGGYTAGFRAEAPGEVNVLVRKEDFATARKLLIEIDADPEVDWSQVDLGQPESPT